MKNFYDMEHGSVVDTSLGAQIIQRFIAESEGDVINEHVEMSISVKNDYYDVLLKIKALHTKARMVTPTFRRDYVFIHGELNDRPILTIISSKGHKSETSRSDDDDDEKKAVGTLDLSIDVYSDVKNAVAMGKAIDGLFEHHKIAVVKWWYQGNHGVTSRDIHLPDLRTKLHKEFYPDLGDPYKFMDAYLNSEASVLMLAGPPGTGKTTLLRHMIVERRLTAHVIYEEKLLEKDQIFQDFLFDTDSDIMIIEDADTILTARERDGNKMMSRFLSVSDGLIKLPNKKLVFTTNITDFGNVDSALLRPGRCFKVVETRALNYEEAVSAAAVAKIKSPPAKRAYTLAQLFNQGEGASVRVMGFV